MGANCSCSTNQTSKQDEIVAEIPAQEKKQEPEQIDLSKKEIDNQQNLVPKARTQGVIKLKKQEMTEKKIRKKTEKQKDGKKKRVKMMLPDEEVDPQDNVIFDPLRDQEISQFYYPSVLQTLKKHFILSQLSPSQLQYVVNKLKFCVSEPDNYIFKQGDKSFSYYIILEGQCLVQIGGQKKKTLTSGQSFGDLGIIYSAPRSASIFSVGQCLLAELDRISFGKIISELNLIYESENRKALEKLQFYSSLSELQKNALAASCITQVYESGKTIFNKGDAANAYYVVREGIVTILQKKIDLKPGDNLGSNALLQESSTRSGTLIAKTRCKLLSITKSKIQQVLGDSITNIVNKKLAQKIISQSSIYDLVRNGDWDEIISNMSIKRVEQKDIVLMKNAEYDSMTILIIMGTDLKNGNKTRYFTANSIIQEGNMGTGKNFKVSQNFYAQSSGFFAILKCPEKKNSDGLFTISTNSIKDNKDLFNINDFYVIRKLRSGNFGRVFACCNKQTNKRYALKVMHVKKLKKQKVIHYIQKQEQVLSLIPKHPFIVRFYQSIKQGDMLVHVLNLIEGEDMFETLLSMMSLPDLQLRFYIKQLVLILEHLHKYKVVYRDLKPENIMVGEDGYLTLIDFGTAKKLTIQNRYKTNTVIGTPHYMAPQIISGKGYGFPCDWWSLGILTYELKTGKLPFGEFSDDPYNIYEQIHKKCVSYPASVDSFTKQLIEKLLNKSQQDRWGSGYEDLKRLSFFSRTGWEKLLQKKEQPSYLPGKITKITSDQVKKAYKRKNNKMKEVFLNSSMCETRKNIQMLAKSNHK